MTGGLFFAVKTFMSQIKAVFAKISEGKLDYSDLSLPPFEKTLPWIGSVVVGFLLATAAGWAVAYVWMPQGQVSNERAPELASVSTKIPPKPSVSEFEAIFQRNLFDSAGSAKVADVGTGCTPQKSSLPLILRGVIFGGTSETSIVLLESTSTREVDSFVLAESVPGNATISDITEDRVYFIQNGCPEYLEAVQPDELKRRVADPSRRTPRDMPSANSQAVDFAEDGFERSGENINVTKQWIDQAVTVDFAKTLQDAKASPNMVGGQVKGFVLTQIRPDSVYEKMGFKNGDVVRSINGIELNDAARAIQTLQAMKTETSLEVTFESEGKVLKRKIQVK